MPTLRNSVLIRQVMIHNNANNPVLIKFEYALADYSNLGDRLRGYTGILYGVLTWTIW